MSERTEVEVLLPLARAPKNDLERRELIRTAFQSASDLVKPGRVLGLVGMTSAVNQETGGPVLKVRFAVEAPEAMQPQRRLTVTR